MEPSSAFLPRRIDFVPVPSNKPTTSTSMTSTTATTPSWLVAAGQVTRQKMRSVYLRATHRNMECARPRQDGARMPLEMGTHEAAGDFDLVIDCDDGSNEDEEHLLRRQVLLVDWLETPTSSRKEQQPLPQSYQNQPEKSPRRTISASSANFSESSSLRSLERGQSFFPRPTREYEYI